MDGVSVAASIVAIATAGIQVSIKVVTLAGQISTASDRVSSIGNDVSLTSAILHQLGDLMSQKTTNDSLTIFSQAGLETTKNSADICKRIFKEVEKETAKASELIRGRKQRLGEKIKLSIVEKAKWPFLQPGLDVLRTDLREAKGTLMLMLQVASLALSKRVADLNISASSSVTKQQDIVRSILILQQQQQRRPYSDFDIKEEPVEGGQKTKWEASRDVKETNPSIPTLGSHVEAHATNSPTHDGLKSLPSADFIEQEVREVRMLNPTRKGRRTSREEPQDVVLGVTNSKPSEQLSPATSGKSTPVRINSNGQISGRSSPDNRASQDHVPAGDAKVEELRAYSIYPDIRFELERVTLAWIWSDIRISEGEIRGRLARNEADGLKSASEILETLAAFELPIVVRGIERIEFANPRSGITLLSVRRTEQDLQHGSIVFKGVPSFQLIIQQDRHSRPRRQAKNSKVKKTKALARPTYIKVHRKHMSPETLEVYALPWEWDKRDLNYIIIKQWIPEHDLSILFEHTSLLRDKNEPAEDLVVFKRKRDNLCLVRKKPSGRERAHSRSWIFDDHGSSTRLASDNEDALPEGRTQAGPALEHERNPYSETPTESSGATGTWAEEEQSPTEDERDEPALPMRSSKNADAVLNDETGEMAAVNKLLEKYTTLFETRD